MSINIQESFNKMPLGEKIILPAAILLFIDSFLKWYSAGGCTDTIIGEICASVSRNAWQSPGAIWGSLAVLIAMIMAARVILTRFVPSVKLPALPQGLTWARVYAGLGGLVALFVIIKLLSHSSDLAYGFFIGIICAAALAAGGGLLFQAEREGGGGSTGSTGSTM